MGKLGMFNFLTLNGYYEGPHRDISWHRHGAEENEFAAASLNSGSILLFGRVTYEMMASYWPTPLAIKSDPVVAEGMNKAEKIVFSRTLARAEWANTRVVRNNIGDAVERLKMESVKDLTILGSGSIVTQLAGLGLIDEFQFMIDPVALGAGTSLFNGLQHKLDLALTKTRIFKSGVVLLCYEPLRR